MTTVLLEAGHGAYAFTQGKFSPPVVGLGIDNDPTVFQGRFREGTFNRLVVKEIANRLKAKGVDARIIVPEDSDISLAERARRVNAIARSLGSQNCLLVSVHANAAGNCSVWTKANGLQVHVCRNASAKSKVLARYLYDAGAARGLAGDRAVPAAHFWTDNFYILTQTVCPAVLTENLFYDNKQDLLLLASEAGRKTIVEYHVEAILKYINNA